MSFGPASSQITWFRLSFVRGQFLQATFCPPPLISVLSVANRLNVNLTFLSRGRRSSRVGWDIIRSLPWTWSDDSFFISASSLFVNPPHCDPWFPPDDGSAALLTLLLSPDDDVKQLPLSVPWSGDDFWPGGDLAPVGLGLFLSVGPGAGPPGLFTWLGRLRETFLSVAALRLMAEANACWAWNALLR